MISEYQLDVSQEADKRYDDFLSALLGECVSSGLLSLEEEEDFKKLLLNRGGLPRLVVLEKRVRNSESEEARELFHRFLSIREKCGLIYSGGGTHAFRDMETQEKVRTMKEMSEVTANLKLEVGGRISPRPYGKRKYIRNDWF